MSGTIKMVIHPTIQFEIQEIYWKIAY